MPFLSSDSLATSGEMPDLVQMEWTLSHPPAVSDGGGSGGNGGTGEGRQPQRDDDPVLTVSRADEATLAALGRQPEFAGHAEARIAAEQDRSSHDVRTSLSRLLASGRIRIVRSDGVMCYERIGDIPLT